MNQDHIPRAWFRWTAVFILAASLSSAAAELRLVSTVPTDGDVSVAVDGTVSMTFDAPIDTTALFKQSGGPHYLGMELYPLDKSSRPDSTTFSPDMKTVFFHDVHLFFDTQYVLVVTGAKSAWRRRAGAATSSGSRPVSRQCSRTRCGPEGRTRRSG